MTSSILELVPWFQFKNRELFGSILSCCSKVFLGTEPDFRLRLKCPPHQKFNLCKLYWIQKIYGKGNNICMPISSTVNLWFVKKKRHEMPGLVVSTVLEENYQELDGNVLRKKNKPKSCLLYCIFPPIILYQTCT